MKANKVLLIFIFICLAPQARTAILVKSPIVPIELKLMVQSINVESLGKKEKKKLIALLVTMGSHLDFIDKERLQMMVKAETYKLILETNITKTLRSGLFTKGYVEGAHQYVEKNKAQFTPFARWVLNSLLKDSITIAKIPTSIAKGDAVKSKQKLLAPWLSALKDFPISQMNLVMNKLQWKCLARINHYLSIYTRMTGAEPKISREVANKHFDLPTWKSQADKKELPDSEVKVIEEVIKKEKKGKSKKKAKKKKGWKPKES